MINQPRRAVTRFFIPLIDVLILLFCIFLLMPFVSGPPSAEPSDPKSQPKELLPDNVADLQRELTEARERIKRMEKAAQARVADRLSVRVLYIDRNNGKLYYYDPDRKEILTEQDAQRLIDRQTTLAASTGRGINDILFLILYPEDQQGFPTKKQEEQIHDWFRGVPHKFQ